MKRIISVILTETTTIIIPYAIEDELSDIDLNEIIEIKGHVERDVDDPFYIVVDEIIKRWSLSQNNIFTYVKIAA